MLLGNGAEIGHEVAATAVPPRPRPAAPLPGGAGIGGGGGGLREHEGPSWSPTSAALARTASAAISSAWSGRRRIAAGARSRAARAGAPRRRRRPPPPPRPLSSSPSALHRNHDDRRRPARRLHRLRRPGATWEPPQRAVRQHHLAAVASPDADLPFTAATAVASQELHAPISQFECSSSSSDASRRWVSRAERAPRSGTRGRGWAWSAACGRAYIYARGRRTRRVG